MGWRRNADEERYYWRVNHWLTPLYTSIGSGGNVERGILAYLNVPIDDDQLDIPGALQAGCALDQRPDSVVIQKGGAGSQFAELIPGTFRAKQNKDNDYFIDRALQRTSSFARHRFDPGTGPHGPGEHGGDPRPYDGALGLL